MSSETPLPRFKLFPSTWLLGGLLVACLVALNLAARPMGWPWEFQTMFAFDTTGAIEAHRVEMSPVNIVCDLLLVVAIAGGVSFLWEWRRRNRRSVWQFTLADLTATLTVIGIVLAAVSSLYHDTWCEARLIRDLEGGPLIVEQSRWEVEYLLEKDDWISKLGIPEEWRPHRRTILHISSRDPFYNHAARIGYAPQTIGAFRSLTQLDLENAELPADDWMEISRLKKLEQLRLSFNDLNDQTIRSYRPPETLSKLTVAHSPALTDAGLTAFASARNLDELRLSNLESVKGHTLGKFQSLSSLSLEKIPLDDAGLEQIAMIPGLSNLTIDTGIEQYTTHRGWLALRGCAALEVLEIESLYVPSSEIIDDDFIRMLPELRHLTRLELTGCQKIAPQTWAELAKCPALKTVEVDQCTLSGRNWLALNKSPTLLSVKARFANSAIHVELEDGEFEQFTIVQQEHMKRHIFKKEDSGKIILHMKEIKMAGVPWE